MNENPLKTGTLKACYCGNFGDDGPDDLCNRECEVNQCDGCCAGMTLDGDIHRSPDGQPFMVCTKERYK